MHDFKARRLAAGLSQAALGAMVGCNQTTIGRVENGKDSTPALLKAIDEALPKIGLTPVFEGSTDKREPLDVAASIKTVTDALHDKIRMQGEMIEAQKQTIESQKGHIATLEKRCLEWERWSALISKT